MRVRQVNQSDLRGGAARAARRLNEGLRRIGVDSRMVVADRLGDARSALLVRPAPDLGAEARALALLHAAQGDRVMRGRTEVSNTLFSLDAPGLDLTAVDEVAGADIVHLHWTSYFLSPQTIARLAADGRSVVWTLHDQWAYTGGCHYASGCSGYRSACTSCPQLVPSAAPLARAMLAEKQRSYGKCEITLVAPSRWMAECVRESAMLKTMRVECIPNGVETDVFTPGNQSAARQALALPLDGVVLLFGVEFGAEKRKGYEVIARALESLRATMRDDDAARVRLLFFGQPASGVERLGFAAHSLGYVNDDQRLRDAYRAADLFVLPSLEDNLPNTMLEAMACAVPVLASDSGGMPDVIRRGDNGLLAARGDPEAFCTALRAAIDEAGTLRTLGLQARRDIARDYSVETVARRHLTLYEDLRSGRAPRVLCASSALDACVAPEVAASEGLLQDPDFVGAMASRPKRWQRLKADLANARRLLRAGGPSELARQGARLLGLLLALRRAPVEPLAASGVALGDGFRTPEGPYPRMNLPRLAWIEKSPAIVLVRRAATEQEVRLSLQARRLQSIRITVDGQVVTGDLSENFCNRERAAHRLSVRVGPGSAWAKLQIDLDGGPEGSEPVVLITGVATRSAAAANATG